MRKKRVNSNSKKSKSIIRSEMRGYFRAKDYGVRTSLDAMKMDADSYNAGGRGWHSDYAKGAALVDAGGLACYYSDQRNMLRKIYGKQVDNWSGNQVHSKYKHLIGREYAAMMRQKRK